MTESRRDFLRMAGRRTAVAGVIGTVVTSSIGGMIEILSLEGNDATIDPNPLQKEDASAEQQPIACTDIMVAEIPIKLCGVEHTHHFASQHYEQLEELVHNATFVISESNPELAESKAVQNSARSYFSTTFQFCQHFGKSVVSLDPRSFIGSNIEFIMQGLGGAIYTSIHASDLWKENTKLTTRKELLKTTLGFYFFTSALGPGGLRLKTWFSGEGEEGLNTLVRRELFFYDHIIDQRNVELTTRLQNLQNIIPSEEFSKGEYVLVNFGKGHTLGMEYYLQHPITHKIKSVLYAPTYGLVDSNEIALFVPDGKENWEKRILN